MKTRIIAIALAVLGAAAAAAKPIDLTATPFYARVGFDMVWTYYEPSPTDPAWIRVPPNPGKRPIVIRELGLPGTPERALVRALPAMPQKYCLVAGIDVDEELLGSSSGVGLYLAQIGENWEVYLNGSIIKSEVHLRRSGAIERDRSVRGALVNIDKRYLKAGKNILSFMIVGDPGSDRTGFFAGGPYIIDTYQNLVGRRIEYLDLMLIGIYFFFALYHVLLFAMRPKNRPYLLYGLGALALSLFLLARTYIVFDIVPDSAVIKGVELASLFLLFPIFMGFFDELNEGRISLFTKCYGLVAAILALAALFVFQELILRIWQWSSPIPILYLLVVSMAMPMIREWKRFRAGLKGEGSGPDLEAFRHVLLGTDLGKLLVGLLVVLGTFGYDILNLTKGGQQVTSRYGFLVLVLGTAAVLAGQYHRLYDEVEGMAASLEVKVRERTAALRSAMAEQSELNERLTEANDQYRNAMEVATKDMRMAAQVQQGIFPSRPPSLSDWELSFVYRPASGVSGDFYDFYVEGETLRGIVLGEVSGRGIGSGLVTVLARTAFSRCFLEVGPGALGEVAAKTGIELAKELASLENILSCVLLRLRGGIVEYVNAGHADLAYRRAGATKANLLSPAAGSGHKGAPLGPEIPSTPYRTLKFELKGGDSLLAYTRGLVDARDGAGQAFGDEGLLTAYGRAPHGTAAETLDYIVQEWGYHLGTVKAEVDLAAVLLRRKG
jgi:serine phosphatase RsbU (regulator of sigma subunit)